jgi:hypothetical protein
MSEPSVAQLAGAQGKFAAFIAVLLERAGVARASELADLLDVYAATVSETDPVEGDLLIEWAEVVRATLPA